MLIAPAEVIPIVVMVPALIPVLRVTAPLAVIAPPLRLITPGWAVPALYVPPD